MKKILKTILKLYLKAITKIVLFIHKPIVIAVTGTTNKSFTKDNIAAKLKSAGFSVRSHKKSFNTEIGLPLAILNLESGYNSYKKWIPTILKAPIKIFKKFPKFLIVEFGISDPKDMEFLLSIVRPDIGVITDISQRYMESFNDINRVKKEYGKFTEIVARKGKLFLNLDSSKIKEIYEEIGKEKCETFSINSQSSFQAENLKKTSTGQQFNIKESKHIIDKFGKHHVYSYLCAYLILGYVQEKYKDKKF